MVYGADEMKLACENAGLAPYQIAALSELCSRIDLRDKRVLEVGGSNLPRALVFDVFSAAEWVSVDLIAEGRYQLQQQSAHYEREGIADLSDAARLMGASPYLILNGAIEDAVTLPSEHFDVVVSITSLEHILAMPSALLQMRRVIKRDGCIFSYHGPIWSSYCGHHIWVDDELNFNNPAAIPAFGHLLCRPPEMFASLEQRFGHQRSEQAVLQMYHAPRINRLFYEDYVRFFELAGFSSVEATSYGRTQVPSRLQARLEMLHPGYRVFDAYGMIAVIR